MSVGAILSSIFVLLSALHWYWVFGGKMDIALGVPEVAGKPAFTPGPVSTAAVAILLLVAAAMSAMQAELFDLYQSNFSWWSVMALVVLFGARAIGDFRLVGLFKTVRHTRFARMDSWLYSPLCLAISALSAWLLRS